MTKYTFSEAECKSMHNGSALSASRFLSACRAADQKSQRKFYIGDKVIILAGEHVGKTMLICGKTDEYIAGGIDGQTVRINNQDATIISR